MDEGKEGRKPRKEERNENNYKDRVGEKVRQRQRDMHVGLQITRAKARARKIGRDREKGRDRVIEKGKETERMGERE